MKKKIKTKAHRAPLKIEKISTLSEGAVTTPMDEAILSGDSITTDHIPFASELQYEGYRDIQEYDNTVLNSDVTRQRERLREINPDDRPFSPSVEENQLDPQEHSKD
jgi:aconitase A